MRRASVAGSTAQLPADRGNRALKALDRIAGIPAVGTAGVARRLRGRRPVPKDWQSIGLVETAAVGDVILLSGVVRDLRAARPNARIVLFATSTNAGFARLLDGPDEVVVLPVRAIASAVRRVRAEDLDVCVDFGAWPRFDALVTTLSGARCTVGRRTTGQHRHFGYDIVVDHSSIVHEVANFRRLIQPLGVDSTSDPQIAIPLGPSGRTEPYAVLHLWPGGANFQERSWPDGRWRELAEIMNARGLDVVLTGGPGDVVPTAAVVGQWAAGGVRATSAAGNSPEDCARLLGGASIVVSVNTGVMHLAAALGVPTVGLSGPTSCRRWGPVGPRALCVASPDVPEGYLDLGFERDGRYPNAMSAISVAAVLEAWDQVTSHTKRPGLTSPGS
jgi:ADP-heptose:LPS heptosyltransferase